MRAWSILAALLLTASSVGAQVPQFSFAFTNSRVRLTTQGHYRYEYELKNTGEDGAVLSHVILDIRTPRSVAGPQILRSDDRFLFDALAERPNPTYSHAPIGIETPENWWSSVYYTAVVSWRAESNLGGVNYGVRNGQTVQGFALESPALPAFRKFRAIPFRMPRVVGDVRTKPDSTWILREGYVVAPGVSADQVNSEYLLEQIEGACYFRAISDCERYRGMARRLRLAEEGESDELYHSHIRRMRGMLAGDPAVSPASKLVLESTLRALGDRPPSLR